MRKFSIKAKINDVVNNLKENREIIVNTVVDIEKLDKALESCKGSLNELNRVSFETSNPEDINDFTYEELLVALEKMDDKTRAFICGEFELKSLLGALNNDKYFERNISEWENSKNIIQTCIISLHELRLKMFEGKTGYHVE